MANIVIPIGQPIIDPEKYSVFKTDELLDFMVTAMQPGDLSSPLAAAEWDMRQRNNRENLGALRCTDAVVIRHSDVFAAEALHSYAHSIRAAIKVLNEFGVTKRPELEYLSALSDYFEEQAVAAEGHAAKVPD